MADSVWRAATGRPGAPSAGSRTTTLLGGFIHVCLHGAVRFSTTLHGFLLSGLLFTWLECPLLLGNRARMWDPCVLFS